VLLAHAQHVHEFVQHDVCENRIRRHLVRQEVDLAHDRTIDAETNVNQKKKKKNKTKQNKTKQNKQKNKHKKQKQKRSFKHTRTRNQVTY
jgi:hypothetical protein